MGAHLECRICGGKEIIHKWYNAAFDHNRTLKDKRVSIESQVKQVNPILHGLWEIRCYTGRGTKCPGRQNPLKLGKTVGEQSKFD